MFQPRQLGRHGDRVSGPPAGVSLKVQSPNRVSRGDAKTASAGAARKPRQPGRRKNRVSRGEKKRVCRGEPRCGTTGKTVANRHGDRVSGPPAGVSQKVQSPNCVSRGDAKTASAGAAQKPRQPGRHETASAGAARKLRQPGRARVRHHWENCGKQTWRSSEWAASRGEPKSAKSEPRQPGRRKNRVSRGGAVFASTSYRPICVKSVLGKILERLLNGRLYHFLSKHGHIHDHQYGRSAVMALVHLKETLLQLRVSKTPAVLMSIDFQGAFDSVWHPRVLAFFHERRVPTNLYHMLRTFFQQRSVVFRSNAGELVAYPSLGSPQGSPISPLLWNVVIHDLLCLPLPTGITIQAYADDTIVVIPAESRERLREVGSTVLKT
ncbi:hypothetical protein MRX96_058757 [Rhipicephalus microplus]